MNNSLASSSAHDNPQEELKQAIHAAARWYALLQSPDISSLKKQDWQHWLEQDANHRLAWRQVEQVQGALTSIPGEFASTAPRGAALSRRELLQRLGMIAVAAPVGLTAWQLVRKQPQGQYRTATGQQHELALVDGGLLMLNTNSAVDITYSDTARIITLYHGEILIQTASDTLFPERPFYVTTPHGRVRALGTRFTVRSDGHYTRVTVLEDRVRITPTHSQRSQELNAGQQVRFTETTIHNPVPAPASESSWINGSLMVVDQPLRQVLEELSRYRHGLLTCSDAIADLKISGTFPLDDTDRAIAVIARAFPVREWRATRYWVRLVAG